MASPKPSPSPEYGAHFQDERKPVTAAPDLVWGKVRSHPWWPGVILDSSLASPQALQHRSRDRVLVCFFADKTFAWADPSALRPFRTHFAKLHGHTTAEPFASAVEASVAEASRRVELAMSCACVRRKLPDGPKEWRFENAGVKEWAVMPAGDAGFVRKEFEPVQLVSYLSGLACAPRSGVDPLDLHIAKAQLRAVDCYRGCPVAPQFNYSYGWDDTELEMPAADAPANGGSRLNGGGIQCVPATGKLPKKKKKMSMEGKAVSAGNEEAGCKKVKGKTLKKVLREGNEVSAKEDEGDEEAAGCMQLKKKTLDELLEGEKMSQLKGSPSASARKRKVSELDPLPAAEGSEKKKLNKFEHAGTTPRRTPSPAVRTHYKMGECMLRAAGRLSLSPIVKANTVAIQEKESLSEVKAERDGVGNATTYRRRTRQERIAPQHCSSSSNNEELLQLRIAASHPLKVYGFATSVIGFFTDFRKSVVPKSGIEEIFEKSLMNNDIEPAEMTWEEEPSTQSWKKEGMAGGLVSEALEQSESQLVPCEPNTVLNSLGGETQTNEDPKDDKKLEECREETTTEKAPDEVSVTGLMLNFSVPDSIPSESDITRIFNQYGPLLEDETQISKSACRVQVFFQRRVDARAAFAAAGKITELGPSLISYRLMSSGPSASSSTQADKDQLPF